jgi:hypothetical protein
MAASVPRHNSASIDAVKYSAPTMGGTPATNASNSSFAEIGTADLRAFSPRPGRAHSVAT